MQRKPWRHSNRHKQPKKENLIMLEQTVKDVQASLANSTAPEAPALVKTDSVLDSLRAENTLLHRDNESLRLDLAAAQAKLAEAQTTLSMPVAATAKVECSIQYDVKAPDMARWRNDGWEVKHYQFVSNGTSTVPDLAVVMERPAGIKPELFRRDEEMGKSENPAPLNFADTQKVDALFADELDEIVIEEEPVIVPEFVPSMDTAGVTIEQPEASSRNTDTVLKKLAQNKPIFAAIMKHGAAAVIDAMDAQVYDVGRAAYEAAIPADTPPWRFESKLLSAGNTTTSNVNPDTIALEEIEIEAVLS